jgi:prophage tail gpP-like protein
MPVPTEIAKVIVNGAVFEDWESVWVQLRLSEAYSIFRFTAAEDPSAIGGSWLTAQFKPGDDCEIELAGFLAITGIIVERQTAYDANNHGVLLQGYSVTWYAAKSSVKHDTGSFDGKTFEQIAREVIAPYKVGVETRGQLDNTPFVDCQNQPGETVWDFLECIARPRGVIMGSDHLGNFLLIGQHSAPLVDHLIEGVNILSCQCVISIENFFGEFNMRGSTPASDPQYGPPSSEQDATVPGQSRRYSYFSGVAEQPVWNRSELQARAEYERIWHMGTLIQATIVLQGWLNGSGKLWRPGDKVKVTSPMAMLDMVLKIQTVTFSQDEQSGTLTTLDLVVPWLLRDGGFDLSTPQTGRT